MKIDEGRSILEVTEELRGGIGRTVVLPEIFTESDIFLGRPCSFTSFVLSLKLKPMLLNDDDGRIIERRRGRG